MTVEGWKQAVMDAVREADQGYSYRLDLLAMLLNEQDEAKNELSRRGYGVMGTPWSQVVREVPELNEDGQTNQADQT